MKSKPVRFSMAPPREDYSDEELLAHWRKLRYWERIRLFDILTLRGDYGTDYISILKKQHREYEVEGQRILATAGERSAVHRALDPELKDPAMAYFAKRMEQEIRELYPEVLKAIGKTPREEDADKLADLFGRDAAAHRQIRDLCLGERYKAKDLAWAIVLVCYPQATKATPEGRRRLINGPRRRNSRLGKSRKIAPR